MLRPKFALLSNPWCQLMPFPFFRRPVMTVIQTESPSGLLKLSCTDPLICPGAAVVLSQLLQVPSLKIRNSAYWTYPWNLGRSRYSFHPAKTEAVPAGIGKVQVTIELNWFGTVWNVAAFPPSNSRSEARSFCGEQLSGEGRLFPATSCHSVPIPGATRAETTGLLAVPTITFPENASTPPAGAWSV